MQCVKFRAEVCLVTASFFHRLASLRSEICVGGACYFLNIRNLSVLKDILLRPREVQISKTFPMN